MTERWRKIPGFNSHYEVSDAGRVRSVNRTLQAVSRWGTWYERQVKGILLRPGRAKSGHLTVVLGREFGSHTVHALVMLAFRGPTPAGLEIRHLNGNPADNRLMNLAFGTRSRNNQDKKWHAGQSNFRLTPEQVKYIKASLGPHGAGRRLARQFDVAESTISAIKHDRFHRDVRL